MIGSVPEPMYVVTTPAARRLGDLASISNDLDFVSRCCAWLLRLLGEDDPDAIMLQALWSSALIAYCRCFGTGKRGRLQESDLDSIEHTGDIRAFHRKIRDVRRMHIAHSVSGLEQMVVGAVLSPSTPRTLDHVLTMSAGLSYESEAEIRPLAQIALRLRDLVMQGYDEQMLLVSAEVSRLDLDELPTQSSIGFTPIGRDRLGTPSE